MFKQKTILEVKAGERLHRFECDPDSPLGEVHDAICAIKSFIVKEISDRLEAENKKQAEECCSEECKAPEENKA